MSDAYTEIVSTWHRPLDTSALSDGISHSSCGFGRILVLPHPHDGPARLAQPAIGVCISGLVRLKLLPPPVLVRARHRAVIRAAVPEASVDEDGDPRPAEDEVGPSAQPG